MSKSVTRRTQAVTNPPTRRRRHIALGVALIVAVAGVTTWTLWPDEPRQREYLDATACLLTDQGGITGEPARSIWTAMQQASATALVKVQYLQVDGPQSTDNASTYLASLVIGRCGVIIATGQAPIDAVTAHAATYTDARFVTIGAGTPAPNVQVLDTTSPGVLQTGIKKRIDALAAEAS